MDSRDLLEMKIVILCGGLGTRLSEETQTKPKPLVAIGERPILWHVMQIYSYYGFNNFVLALGYKGEMIKQYFLNYPFLESNFHIDLSSGEIKHLRKHQTQWKIDLVDTGFNTLIGGRLKRLQSYLQDKTFMLTYGDGLSNINIRKLLEFHFSHGKIATISAVHPIARFGEMEIEENKVRCFKEKPQTQVGWINGGFFVFEPQVFHYLDGDQSVLEKAPLENLVKDKQLMAYSHEGFWYCMDTLRDVQVLTSLWESGNPPWMMHKESVEKINV